MRKLNAAAAVITIVGGLNWGLAGRLRTLVATSEPTPVTSVTA